MTNPDEKTMTRLDTLERKVSEIDHNIIRLLTLLSKKDSLNKPQNGNSGQPALTPKNTRRLRGGSVPTSAQSASIAHVSIEPELPIWS